MTDRQMSAGVIPETLKYLWFSYCRTFKLSVGIQIKYSGVSVMDIWEKIIEPDTGTHQTLQVRTHKLAHTCALQNLNLMMGRLI